MNAMRALALLPLLLLGGCFDYTEEVFVNADGTGRLRTEMAFLSEMLEEDDIAGLRQALEDGATQLREHPEVSAVTVTDWVVGPKHHFSLDISAKTYQALPDIVQGDDWLRFEDLEKKQVRFVRALDEGGSAAARALMGRGTANIGALDDRVRDVSMRLLGRGRRLDQEQVDFHVTFLLHAPKVVNSNGEVTGGDVSWRYRLEELEDRAPPRLEAQLDLSRSLLLPIAAGVGLLSFGVAFLWLRKKWNKRYY